MKRKSGGPSQHSSRGRAARFIPNVGALPLSPLPGSALMSILPGDLRHTGLPQPPGVHSKVLTKLPWRTACGRDSPAQNLAERSCKRVSLRVLPEMQSGNFSKIFFFNQNRLIHLRKSCI